MAPDTTTDETTDDLVRETPGDFTVEEVLDTLSRSTPAQVAEVQQLEADGKGRKGIAEYEVPAPTPEEPRFDRARILDPSEGPRIIGYAADHPTIVGALDGDDSESFTRTEVTSKIEAFLGRAVHTTEEA